jgi:hypothetical protein
MAPTNIPSSTSTSKKTPTLLSPVQSNFDQALYTYSFDGAYYGYIIPDSPTQSIFKLGEDLPVFANFADLILRESWDDPSNMCISNLALDEIISEISDPIPICPSFWYWSPDDLHVICDGEKDGLPGSIFHLETKTWEEWSYICDRVSPSAKSLRLATWCTSINKSNSFAVIEWGGEIWYSSSSPTSTLVQVNSDVYKSPWLWGWSADGENIAYFDDGEDLVIANAQGKMLLSLPVFLDWESGESPFFPNVNDIIMWSANGERILVNAKGGTENQCPTSTSTITGEIVIRQNFPCWQVIDIGIGEIIWNLSDYINQSVNNDPEDYYSASISADGRYLALASVHFSERELVILDLDNNEIVWGHVTIPEKMRWGDLPHK